MSGQGLWSCALPARLRARGRYLAAGGAARLGTAMGEVRRKINQRGMNGEGKGRSPPGCSSCCGRGRAAGGGSAGWRQQWRGPAGPGAASRAVLLLALHRHGAPSRLQRQAALRTASKQSRAKGVFKRVQGYMKREGFVVELPSSFVLFPSSFIRMAAKCLAQRNS